MTTFLQRRYEELERKRATQKYFDELGRRKYILLCCYTVDSILLNVDEIRELMERSPLLVLDYTFDEAIELRDSVIVDIDSELRLAKFSI